MKLSEIKKARKENKNLKWNDPDPIEGNDYTITYIEDLSGFTDEDMEDYPVLIQYGGGSEAEVYLTEISLA